MRWAKPRAVGDGATAEPLKKMFATISIEGTESAEQTAWIALDGTGWVELTVEAEYVPGEATSCSVSWDLEKAPSWRKLVKTRRMARSNRHVLLSGPWEHEARS